MKFIFIKLIISQKITGKYFSGTKLVPELIPIFEPPKLQTLEKKNGEHNGLLIKSGWGRGVKMKNTRLIFCKILKNFLKFLNVEYKFSLNKFVLFFYYKKIFDLIINLSN